MKHLITSAALLLVACGDYAPDSDVQISCEGAHAAELCAHASNAAVELEGALDYLLLVRDPEVTGVTWRAADQWRIVSRPVGTRITSQLGPDSVMGCALGQQLGATSYRDSIIYVAECVWTERGWDVGNVLRHELGHALGVTGHPAGGLLMSAELEQGTGPLSYNDADVAAIAGAQRAQSNTAIDAVLID
jgi:hypothetical protein